MYNYHSASLPEFRGAACHSWRLMQNKYSTYINIHKVHEKIDTGDIVRRKKINFSKNYNNLRMSYDYMEKDEKKLFTDFLFKKHNALKQGQNSFYWPRLNTNKDALIDWKWNAKDIVDFCNAFDKPFDGAFSYINNVKVRFTNVKLIEKNTKFHPFQSGIIFRINSKGYYIATNLGALLVKNFKTNTKINLGNRFYSYKK